MRKLHDAEDCRSLDAERQANVAAAPFTVGNPKRLRGGGQLAGGGRGRPWRWVGEGERGGREMGGSGGVLPKRLKSGFGHDLLEVRGPSCGRHKLV